MFKCKREKAFSAEAFEVQYIPLKLSLV